MIHSLVLYVASGIEPVPPDWECFYQLMNNYRGKVPGVSDILCGKNDVKVWDLGYGSYNGLPRGMDFDQFTEHTAKNALSKLANQYPFDIIVAGQTPVAEMVIKGLDELPAEKKPSLVIRFSSYFGENTRPYENSTEAKEAGYQYDCAKDYELLYCLLCCKFFIEAVESKNKKSIDGAITQFVNSINSEFAKIEKL